MTRIEITAHAHHAGTLKRSNEFWIPSRYNPCFRLCFSHPEDERCAGCYILSLYSWDMWSDTDWYFSTKLRIQSRWSINQVWASAMVLCTCMYIAKCPAGGNDGHESFYGWDWLRARVKRNNFPHKWAQSTWSGFLKNPVVMLVGTIWMELETKKILQLYDTKPWWSPMMAWGNGRLWLWAITSEKTIGGVKLTTSYQAWMGLLLHWWMPHLSASNPRTSGADSFHPPYTLR